MSLDTDDQSRSDSDERFSLLEMDLPSRKPGPVEREIASSLAAIAAPAPSVALVSVNPDQARIDALPVRPSLPYRPPTMAQIRATPNMRDTVALQAPSVAPIDNTMLIVSADYAEGSGVGVGWSGRGELPRGTIATIARDLELPEPRAKSEKSHAAKACQSVSGRYDCRASKGRNEWIIHNADDPKNFRRVAIMQLISGKLENDEPYFVDNAMHDREQGDVVCHIRDEYQRRCDGEIMTCNDITLWCDLVMRSLDAIPVAVLWYVPARNVEKAKAFAAAIGAVWGANWTSPPMPMVKSSELSGNLVRGFASECETVLQPLKDVEGAEGGIGSRGAAAMKDRVEQLRAKCRAYAALLGADKVATVSATLDQAIEKINRVADATAQRGAMLELDDAPNKHAKTTW